MVTTTTGLATSFITFTRTSNATVTDSNGFIEWAGHNLLTNSESFDASAWVKSSATVTANTDPAPNGTTTGDTIAASGANGTALQTWTAEAVPYTFGVWLRRKTGTGNIQIAADSGTYTTVTITSSWALYTVTQTPAAGSKSAGIRIVTSGDEVYAWGAHLYRSDLGGMVLNPARGDAYYPTTPRNLLGFTEDFSAASWNAVTNATVVSNIANGPNGLPTADLIYPSSSGSNRQRYQTVAGQVSGTRYTVSVYLKAASMQWIAMLSPNGANYGAYFDLVNGVKGTEASGVTATITSVGDGWYRCSVSQVSSGTTIYCGISFADANGGTTVTASGTSGIYAWGAQLSDSASLDAYSPVYGAAVTSAAYYAPRLDFDPVTLAARGLLVEELRTNVLLHTADFTNAAWQASGATISANTDTAPDGTLTADTVTSSGTDPYVVQVVNATQLTWTFSVWLKGVGASIGKQPMLFLIRDAYAEAINSGNLAALTSQWQRYTFTGTFASAPTQVQARIDTTNTSPASGDAVYIWGAQLEAGSFATSYIPTGAATATRTADVASVSTQAFPYSATEGTVVANVSVLSVDFTNPGQNLWSFYIDSNNIMRSWMWSGLKTTPLGTVIVSGSSSADLSNGTVSANTPFKTGMVMKQNDFAFSLNGGSPNTDTSGPVIAATNTLWLGSLGGTAASSLNGHIRQITYIPRRLSNAELQARTA